MHFNTRIYELAFGAIERLLPAAYAGAYLTVPRSASDPAWRQLEAGLSKGQSIYVAAEGALCPLCVTLIASADTGDADFVALTHTLQRKDVTVVTMAELSAHFRADALDPLVLSAVEQVLLAAATPFWFTPTDLYAEQVISLRERLGIPASAEERQQWLVHTHIPADESRREPRLACELAPEV